MKKTIILERTDDGRIIVLEQMMRGALSYGWTISKDTLKFDSKKDASERIKNHPCGKGHIIYTLNQKQIQILDFLKSSEKRYCIKVIDFLNIK